MADKKISELTAATAGQPADLLPIVQDNVTKKITLGTIFASITDMKVSGLIKIDATANAVTSGAIPLTSFVATLSNSTGANVDFTLAAGTSGLLQFLSVTSTNSTITVTVTGGNGFSTITFDTVGETCLLYYLGGMWHIVSNNGGVIA